MKYYVYGFIWRDNRGKQIGREHEVPSHSALRSHVSAEIGAHVRAPKDGCVPVILWRETRGKK